jgi:L-ascorbate metabolism protein UlaG (beta-lactamase superfamily)
MSADAIGAVDVVLLSHDHHPDNLDHAGRRMLARASTVVTTVAGAGRLSGNAVGLMAWQSKDVPASGGRTLRITAAPARHGPADGDRGPVIGFVLGFIDDAGSVVYVSGDTVWYEGVEEVARRWSPLVAVLFMGAARVAVAGPSHLTLTAAEGVSAARAFPQATIVPLHFEGWAHFTESRSEIERAFQAAGLGHRLHWPEAGHPVRLP